MEYYTAMMLPLHYLAHVKDCTNLPVAVKTSLLFISICSVLPVLFGAVLGSKENENANEGQKELADKELHGTL